MNNDLISREAVLNGKFDCLTTEVNREMYGRLSDIADYVKSIPAADAAKVAHGKWEIVGNPIFDDDVKVSCSMCSWIFDDFYNYCPNCGAIMDGE